MKRSPMARSTTPMARGAGMAAKKPTGEPKRRMRKCVITTCRALFAPISMTHKACGAACAQLHMEQEKARKLRRERQEGLAKLKRRADYLAEAQTAFNAWVRFRDRNLPCICCGKTEVSNTGAGGGWDAGHYLSRGSHPHLRFDERNVFRQRKGCNRPGGTSAAAFRLGVIARIGLASVEALEADQADRNYTVDDLKAIKAEYQAKLKALQRE